MNEFVSTFFFSCTFEVSFLVSHWKKFDTLFTISLLLVALLSIRSVDPICFKSEFVSWRSFSFSLSTLDLIKSASTLPRVVSAFSTTILILQRLEDPLDCTRIFSIFSNSSFFSGVIILWCFNIRFCSFSIVESIILL